ncbi:RICIN domain-containing protein [Streptomyces sp. NPDC088197]|uniref:RICIN domain-containing protein n=1 Tax=Streptomyces sp. NPDC088197 TaxID=3365840 RepID=UPI00381C4EC4
MSESDHDEAKRRQRARFVEALTTHTRQPGEHSRVGSRVAGAVAVLALVAGATLGMGAWRSHQADEHDKKRDLAAQRTAAYKNIAHSASPSPTPKPTKTVPKRTGKPVPHTASPKPHRTPSTTPTPKRTAGSGGKDPRALTAHDRKVLIMNAYSGMCVDIPYNGPGQLGLEIDQYHCDGTDQDNQFWNMTVKLPASGPGGTDLVQFSNTMDGLCIDPPERGAQPSGTELSEANCTGTLADNQLWWLAPAGGDTVWIRNYASNHLCLRVEGTDKKAPSARLVIGSCGTDDDSRWRLLG